MPYIGKIEIQAARKADLYDYLLHNHAFEIIKEGNSLRLRTNKSVSIRAGYSGYRDFATDETGNAIDCLMQYFGYSFDDAVIALAGAAYPAGSSRSRRPSSAGRSAAPAREYKLPEPLQGRYRQLYAYLCQSRGIPAETVQMLVDRGVLYQAADYGNIVFRNPPGTFYELRGTNTAKPFHQVQFSDANAFWWFRAPEPQEPAAALYICEGAIDAISLYLLLQLEHAPNATYVAIGGVANQGRIDAIKAAFGPSGRPIYIAVDNDPAGKICRDRDADLPAIIPARKDWNEDWLAYLASNQPSQD